MLEHWKEHIRPEILAWAEQGEPVSLKQWQDYFANGGRMNSYEFQFAYTLLDNESLCYQTTQLLKQVTLWEQTSYRPRSTYEEVLCMLILPMLIERLLECSP